MERVGVLARVAVMDGGDAARRVLRAARELARIGDAGPAVAFYGPGVKRPRWTREADESVEVRGAISRSLSANGATSAWFGPAPFGEMAAFADECDRAGVTYLGPSVDSLRRLAQPGALDRLARALGLDADGPSGQGIHRIDVVVARDRGGAAQVLGLADVSARRRGVDLLTESPPVCLDGQAEQAARELGLRAAQTTEWVGICTLSLFHEPRTGRFALAEFEPFARSGPAIEALTGVDLARLSITLGAGAKVEAVAERPTGHAFAARIEALDPEDPATPPCGRLKILRFPSRLGVWTDARLREGDDAPAEGDRTIASVVAHDATRPKALARLEQALVDGEVLLSRGASSKPWLLALCALPEVREGRADTELLDRLAREDRRLVPAQREAALLAAALESYACDLDLERAHFLAEARRGRPRVGSGTGRNVELLYGGRQYRVQVFQTAPGTYVLSPRVGQPVTVHWERTGEQERTLSWAGRRARMLVSGEGSRLLVQVDGVAHLLERDPSGIVTSPMPAIVVAVPVAPGQHVEKGEPLARIESMKVELVVPAPTEGVVREVLATANSHVDAGAPLIRLDPIAMVQAKADEPFFVGAASGQQQPAGAQELREASLARLHQLVLGFDVPKGRIPSPVDRDDSPSIAEEAATLDAEDSVLRAFADVQSLFSRRRLTVSSPPPLEELWRYLHEPAAGGSGLTPEFVVLLRRALAHYGASIDTPDRELELALLRMQRAKERVDEQIAPVIAILERRIRGEGPPPGLEGPDARDLLDRLVAIGEEQERALADLAREAQYRKFDQPRLERDRTEAYRRVEEDFAGLAAAEGPDRATFVSRLVSCPHGLVTLLSQRMAEAAPPLREKLLETQLRRYYRGRLFGPVTALDVTGTSCAWSEYTRGHQHLRVAVAFAHASALSSALNALTRLTAEFPLDREIALEAYLWHGGPAEQPESVSASIASTLAGTRFSGPVERVSVSLAFPGQGMGRKASQQHFTFTQRDGTWAEDQQYRGLHPMVFERMHLGRLSRFDLERLPAAHEDVYLFRGVAQTNRKDERLFAVADVRDVTPVHDGSGKVVQLPYLERTVYEAIAGMRLFQARRAAHERLEWNRIFVIVGPPFRLTTDEIRGLIDRLAPAAAGVGLEMVLIDVKVPDAVTGEIHERLLRVIPQGDQWTFRWDSPAVRPLVPMAEYQQKIVQLHRRGLLHPHEILRMLAPPPSGHGTGRHGDFVEYDLGPSGRLEPVERPPGTNTANVVVGVVRNITDRHPEGIRRVAILGDPSREMGSVAEPECRRISAALDLADELGVPAEWWEVCAGAKISMTSGTENMDWVARVLRRIIEFTQRGSELNVVVLGITVGAQPYWNAEATMLMHTRGILIMTPGSAMVLTGKEALEYSGSVSADDNEGIGGYDRIMGPNGQAQYHVGSPMEACSVLLAHYEHAYVAPGEQFPRRAPTADPHDRDVCAYPHGPEGGAGFATVGEIFGSETNPERKKPFEIRRVMAAVMDQDHTPLERWRDMRGGDTAVVWDAHLGGWPVCLIGIQSRPVPRFEFVPADGPERWSAGTLFPQSSKKIARAVNSASGSRPLVVLANLSGFDGSPESMRRLQLEYGAEIGRAVVNFRGPIVFCVVSRYHGGAFVVFAKTLRERIEIAAIEGARASVIGGAPAAVVVFAREVQVRTRADPRVIEAEKASDAGTRAARAHYAQLVAAVRAEKTRELADEFDRVHSVERALRVGSLDRIIQPSTLRPYLIDAVERGMARCREEK